MLGGEAVQAQKMISIKVGGVSGDGKRKGTEIIGDFKEGKIRNDDWSY